jgi:hypothetical protein
MGMDAAAEWLRVALVSRSEGRGSGGQERGLKKLRGRLRKARPGSSTAQSYFFYVLDAAAMDQIHVDHQAGASSARPASRQLSHDILC